MPSYAYEHTLNANKPSLFFLIILLLAVAITPQTHASSVVEKFPTVADGLWIDPLNILARDTNFATSLVFGDYLDCWDFAFNFNETDTIEKVYVKTRFFFYFEVYTPILNMRYHFHVIYDGAEIGSGDMLNIEGIEASGVFGLSEVTEIACDITSVCNQTVLNNVTVQLIGYCSSSEVYLYADYVSLEVAYTTTTPEPTMSDNVPFVIAGFLLALPFLVIFNMKGNKQETQQIES